VNGDRFSIAQPSDEPKLLRKDADMFLVHKIHGSLKTIEFHLHRREVQAEGARRGQAPGFTDAGHNTIFLEEVDPSRFIFCVHNSWHGKETVVVNVLGKCPP
ncbi:hypothetical protein PANDA_014070, partial [Ailuropoda melanoleuca]